MAKNNVRRILIIGGGVSGLTTAYCLLKKGYEVTLVAEKFSPDITSNVAGALWEWPPAVCGFHADEVSLKRSKKWCVDSYQAFFELAKSKATGVFIKPVCFFFRESVNDNPLYLLKMNELKEQVKGFRHDEQIVVEEHINPAIGIKDAYCHLAPMIDTDVYLVWLMKEVVHAGAHIIHKKIVGLLLEIEMELLATYKSDFIVNCTGLGAMELTDDAMYPLRGALVRVTNDGATFPVLTKAYCVSFDENTQQQDIIFIVPRGENLLVLGALTEKDEWDTAINLTNYAPLQKMLERCIDFYPALKGAKLDTHEPVRVGLRPFREGSVCLEQVDKHRIVHNYGHGGSGFTFSWGCANEVVQKVEHYFTTN